MSPFMRRAPLVAGVLAVVWVSAAISLAAGATATISGTAFVDDDADGMLDAGEAALRDQQLYLLDDAGAYLGTTRTRADGAYAFRDLAAGDYRVVYAADAWNALRQDWVPTTTEGIRPQHRVTVAGTAATADFGWRRIKRSSDPSSPMSTFVGPSGLTVKSYTDAVDARTVHDLVAAGMVGVEASAVTIHLDLCPYTSTSTSVAESDGAYIGFTAWVYINWTSWLDDAALALGHEYGHAWSSYHAYMTQGDPTLAGYLVARGLSRDERVDSGYLWHRRELIAEDYRQLLGSPTAAAAPQANTEIPAAAAVPGLREYLLGSFVSEGSVAEPSASATPTASATPSASASPSAPATPQPTPTPSPTPTATPTPSPAATPVPSPTASAEPPQLAVTDAIVTPTPVKRQAEVRFSLTVAAQTRVAIYGEDGSLVRVLADGRRSSGPATVAWDRRDERGRRAKPGLYVVRIEATDAAGRVDVEAIQFAAS